MDWGALLFTVLCCWIAYRCGRQNAHREVARECKKIGRFYVGNSVFECIEIRDRSKSKEPA